MEIKRLAMGGDLIEVLVEDCPVTGSELPGVLKVLEDEERGGVRRLKLLVDDSSERLIEIVKALEARGLRVYRATSVFVSLEDAFIKLATGG